MVWAMSASPRLLTNRPNTGPLICIQYAHGLVCSQPCTCTEGAFDRDYSYSTVHSLLGRVTPGLLSRPTSCNCTILQIVFFLSFPFIFCHCSFRATMDWSPARSAIARGLLTQIITFVLKQYNSFMYVQYSIPLPKP